jgi:YD repeat-containing protein
VYSPIKVGTLTNWLSVSGGHYSATAVKTDGTLWAWGYNAQGQLGFGDIIDRSSPTQVGALTTWHSVSGRAFGVLALKSA